MELAFNVTNASCIPLKTVSVDVTNGYFGSSLNQYFWIWAYANGSHPDRRDGYVDYQGWHEGVMYIDGYYNNINYSGPTDALVILIRNMDLTLGGYIDFPGGALTLTLDGSQFNINLPFIADVCSRCNHWFIVYNDGSVEESPWLGLVNSWVDEKIASCPK